MQRGTAPACGNGLIFFDYSTTFKRRSQEFFAGFSIFSKKSEEHRDDQGTKKAGCRAHKKPQKRAALSPLAGPTRLALLQDPLRLAQKIRLTGSVGIDPLAQNEIRLVKIATGTRAHNDHLLLCSFNHTALPLSPDTDQCLGAAIRLHQYLPEKVDLNPLRYKKRVKMQQIPPLGAYFLKKTSNPRKFSIDKCTILGYNVVCWHSVPTFPNTRYRSVGIFCFPNKARKEDTNNESNRNGS